MSETAPPKPYLTSQLVGEAIQILKSARVEPARMDRTGSVVWKDGAQMHRAFELHNEHAGRGFLSHGCRPCHGKVFNWLMDVAFQDVQVQQLSITDEPAEPWQVSKEGFRAVIGTTPAETDTESAVGIQ